MPIKPSQGKLPSKNSKASAGNPAIFAAGVVLITAIVLSSVLNCDFLTWDDPDFVLYNTNVHELSFKTLASMFSSYTMGNYCPLATLSLAIDFKLAGGLHPMMFHLTSLLLHLTNTLLVFLIVYNIFAKQVIAASVAALLFGIHPMHLESVAWVSERRDVLYALFYLSGLLSYVRFYNNPQEKKYLYYALGLFLCSLLSKGQAVTFPIALLAIDFIKGRKISIKYILDKIPFIVLALAFGILAVIAQKATKAIAVVHLPSWYPFFTGFYGLLLYILKALIPFNLCVHHPYPWSIHSPEPILFFAAPAFIIAFGIFAYRKWKSDPVIAGGLLFFLITLFPVLQFLPAGETIISERYTYLPYIGLFIIAGYLTQHAKEYFFKYKNAVSILVTAWIGVLCIITWTRVKVWHDPVSFWSDAIERYPGDKFAYCNRGYVYLQFENYDAAFSDFSKGIAIDTTFGRLFVNRGACYEHWKKYDSAMADFNRATRWDSSLFQPYVHLAQLYMNVYGNYPKAIYNYNIAIEKNPDPAYQSNLGIAYYDNKEYKNSIATYNKLLESDSTDGKTYYLRAITEAAVNEYSKAYSDATKSKKLGYTDIDEAAVQQWKR